MKMDCIINYDGYTDNAETVVPISSNDYNQLKMAAEARHERGGDHVSNHSKQIRNIPTEFKDNMHIHWKCYKKFTLGMLEKQKESETTDGTDKSPERTGELKKTILPNICQFCKKGGLKAIKRKSRKQPLGKITLRRTT